MRSKNLAKTLRLHGYEIAEIKEPQKTGYGFVDIKVMEEASLWVTVGFDFYRVCYVCQSGQEDFPAIVSRKLMAISYVLEDIKEAIKQIEAEKLVA